MVGVKYTVAIGLAVVALGAAGCGSSSSSTKTSTAGAGASGGGGYGSGGYGGGSNTTAPSDSSSATTADSGTSSGAATVSVAANPTKGNILVGPNGHTLYLLDTETGTATSCKGACATHWPALAGTPAAGAGVDASGLSAVSGQVPNQVAYKGHLLYYFSADSAGGDVNGASVPHWFPVGPDGSKVTKG